MGKYYTYSDDASCPFRYKYELVEWAFNLHKGKCYGKSHYQKMTKKQLYAMWYTYDKLIRQAHIAKLQSTLR
tara:strand:- start:333 stop:548 length:216 start_codon:yes stop_codon:yes gene_type:complete